MSASKIYAIIKTGGKQYRVQPGDVIDVELLEGELGETIQFSDILYVFNGSEPSIGQPLVTNFVVRGEIVEMAKGPKIQSIKYIPGNHYRKFGHRQKYSRIKISGIEAMNKGAKHGT